MAGCKKCGLKDEFIVDYTDEGEEYTFCGNCGTVKGMGDLRNDDQ